MMWWHLYIRICRLLKWPFHMDKIGKLCRVCTNVWFKCMAMYQPGAFKDMYEKTTLWKWLSKHTRNIRGCPKINFAHHQKYEKKTFGINQDTVIPILWFTVCTVSVFLYSEVFGHSTRYFFVQILQQYIYCFKYFTVALNWVYCVCNCSDSFNTHCHCIYLSLLQGKTQW